MPSPIPASQSSSLSHSNAATERVAGTSSSSTSPNYSTTTAASGGVGGAAGTANVIGSGDGNGSESRVTSSQTRSSRSGDGMKRFQLSPVPTKNPLGEEGRCIRTAAALVIGDEILNGKTMDKNSNYFAKFCFERGIDLKRIEVIPDDEAEIIEASRRMVDKYDFVITTGGIGPTHDDITYASLARAFNQSLIHDSETLRRLDEMNRHRAWVSTQTPQQREATKRMALFPDKAEVLFVCGDIWVPVVRLEGKLCIFPGIPMLFTKMLDGLSQYLPLPPASERPLRVQIFTERPESMIAPYLTSLHARLKKQKADIQVGSYPVLGKGVFVSLIGRDRHVDVAAPAGTNHNASSSDSNSGGAGDPGRIWLAQIASEVEKEIGGRIVSDEEVKMLKEGAVGEVRRRMEEGDKAAEAAAAMVREREREGVKGQVDDGTSSASFASSRASSLGSAPASVSASDSASVLVEEVGVQVDKARKPKLGEAGWS
ncbi:hypothetical protein GYMLUDRAFT_42880 [Collybiopsis luxurians FD-317 M1]|uniref:MoaB/Mog domain-containing protein n=1 Tax=Collybiopsis luxurians FD-317 M1 TaxID=944289 RepID=A0A0D0CQI4_9AGAR|nr:hypothetical protein GYMLUDRAFT_42880 [Collybiopsis luxurians FD-317 M1]